ncbi:MAG TPA: tetratricopeptide repeat-containing protein [Pyrinomonadaceae bacterium]|nr:tetratricopeptide repeat-containing protein [Pyrinomonadaceae bacterium]
MPAKSFEKMRAFIVTPFGKKKDAKGNEIDFDLVRTKLIEPALDRLGVTGRTTQEIIKAGNIRVDMFQRLLVADLVVAEVSIHNANVFYELGIRHALRENRTFMLRRSGDEGDKAPFDLQTDRYMTYDGADPAKSVDDLVAALSATLDSDDQDSPVFRSLPSLREQERSHFLSVPVEFREEVERALADKQRGDLDLLALETRGFEWGMQGLRVVGRAQIKLRDFKGARSTWEGIRDAYADDKEANTWLATIYQRQGELKRSDQALDRVLLDKETTPRERAEAYTLLGRNAKTRWIEDWKGAPGGEQHPPEEWRERALRSRYLLDSYEACAKGFNEDLNHFYSGLNALAMLKVLTELAAAMPDIWAERFDDDEGVEAALKLAALKKEFASLAPSVGLSIQAAVERLQREANAETDLAARDAKVDELTWARISYADHCCLTSDKPNKVRTEYQNSLTGVADFYGESASKQLLLYEDLELLTNNVAAALEVIKPEKKAEQGAPRIIVFTGHRVDSDPALQRFPPDKEPEARKAIKEAVEKELERAGGNAIGIAGGASGGDILFHEVCEELNVPTRLYLALPREEYIKESVQDAGREWVRRFNQLYEKKKDRRILSGSKDLPKWLREKGESYSIWKRNNLWVLSNAVALDSAGGGINLTLIALWNGKEGVGPGGTKDMVEKATERGAETIILPTEQLFGLAPA